MPSFIMPGAPPPYLQGLVGDPYKTGKRTSKTKRSWFQRPQDYSTLRDIYEKSVATAPGLMTGVGQSEIDRIFEGAVRAQQEMGLKSSAARGGERGASPVWRPGSTGVKQQQLMSAMMPLRQRMGEFAMMDALALAEAKRSSWQKGLESLFGAASSPVSGGEEAGETLEETLETREAPGVRVEYPGGGGGGGGSRGGGGGGGGGSRGGGGGGGGGAGTSSDGWWRGKSLGWSPPGIGDTAGGGGSDWGKSIGGLPDGGGGGGLGGPGVWPDRDEPPGGGPSPLPGGTPSPYPSPDEPDEPQGVPGGIGDAWEYTQGGSGAGAFMARRPKGSTGSYGRF